MKSLSSRVTSLSAVFLVCLSSSPSSLVFAFVPPHRPVTQLPAASKTTLGSSNNNENNNDFLKETTPGGFTVKQRLREEVEFPFRSVRLFFFGYSTVSALVALYFSMLNTLKASMGGYTDVPPLEECLQNDAINLGGALVCGALVYRDWKAGKANLNRIAKGGQLAQLVVEPAATIVADEAGLTGSVRRVPLAAFRRQYRVLICAGGANYIQRLAQSLASDQLQDQNTLPQQLKACDVVVVPVLMQEGDKKKSSTVVDTASFWNALKGDEVSSTIDDPDASTAGRNFNVQRAASVIQFPRGTTAWQEYLQSEIETAQKQGFDVLEKGITLTIKKNGKVLRRATGLPPWGDLISTMEVMDGSKFGMPGDDEKYGGN